jgi:hypothetical protein
MADHKRVMQESKIKKLQQDQSVSLQVKEKESRDY